jgi:uncharacterized Zn-binding protein involved in type VI secretion
MTLGAQTVHMDIDYMKFARMGSFGGLAEATVADRLSSGQVRMEDRRIAHGGKPYVIDGHPRKGRFDSCCCKSHLRSRSFAVDRMEILDAQANRGFHGCMFGE